VLAEETKPLEVIATRRLSRLNKLKDSAIRLGLQSDNVAQVQQFR